ncbi:hypothetical protein BB559_001572 [Furculomyces boomerangus]|uniref:RING-type domain-containing protein n=2 Tax=Harpellales TaxID=61421 RepID=A0A2T9XYG8_9FUNG|nr:hypothetical protein BB559_007205 [Furculomyces boomerangus]PVU98443.1 hypothetical protein BB559_001572 [Furculomyces boomerangus]PWA01066.1 hypothetical protein BB558_002852 [Smittium angustum]
MQEELSNSAGCSHYKRNAMIKAECCKKWVWCRFCHDENENHEMNRFLVKEMKCSGCDLIQNIDSVCKGCHIVTGKYYCEICKLLDNDTTKKAFHCDKCGLCRAGGRDNFFHCDKCGICLSLGLEKNHICIEKNLQSNCPVCMEFLYTSTLTVILLSCGHPIHQNCATDLINHYKSSTDGTPKCPECQRSIIEEKVYTEEMDLLMSSQKMPEEFRKHKSSIFCNDCRKRSVVPYHFVYHKCGGCGSYNTIVRSTNIIEEETENTNC